MYIFASALARSMTNVDLSTDILHSGLEQVILHATFEQCLLYHCTRGCGRLMTAKCGAKLVEPGRDVGFPGGTCWIPICDACDQDGACIGHKIGFCDMNDRPRDVGILGGIPD